MIMQYEYVSRYERVNKIAQDSKRSVSTNYKKEKKYEKSNIEKVCSKFPTITANKFLN